MAKRLNMVYLILYSFLNKGFLLIYTSLLPDRTSADIAEHKFENPSRGTSKNLLEMLREIASSRYM